MRPRQSDVLNDDLTTAIAVVEVLDAELPSQGDASGIVGDGRLDHQPTDSELGA